MLGLDAAMVGQIGATSATTIGQVAVICTVGILLWRYAILDPLTIRQISRAVYFALSPALMLGASQSFSADNLSRWAVLPGACVVHMAVASLLGWGAANLVGVIGAEKKIVILACTFHNLGALPFVFVAALSRCWPRISDNGPEAMADGVSMIIIYGLPWQCLLYSVGLMIIRSTAVTDDVNDCHAHLPLADLDHEDEGPTVTELRPLEPDVAPALSKRKCCDMLKETLLVWIWQPGTMAIIACTIVGCISWIQALFFGKGAPLSFLRGALTTLGEAAVPMNTLVLASGLAQAAGIVQVDADVPLGESEKQAVVDEPTDSLRLSTRALVSICVVKLLVAPLVSVAGMVLLLRYGLLGDVYSLGPLFLFLLLVQPAMPSAQSLVMLFQVEGQSDNATRLSSVYIFQYSLAMFTMTLWVTVVVGIVEVLMP